MPYIRCMTNDKFTPEQTEKLKAKMGELIAIIPEKSEEVLMVQIEDGCKMYFMGKDIPCMMINVEMYTEAGFEYKKEFTAELFKAVEQMTNVPSDNIYMNFSEFSSWGDHGRLKKED